MSPKTGIRRVIPSQQIGKGVIKPSAHRGGVVPSNVKPKPPTPQTTPKDPKTKRLYVLDTNVLMHDPSCIFRFQEHDIYLCSIVLEEIDNHKKGHDERNRNVREFSRTIDKLISDCKTDIDQGISLKVASGGIASGRIFLQAEETMAVAAVAKPDNKIIATVLELTNSKKGSCEVVLVSKDINMRIKGRTKKIIVEDYHNDMVIEDSDLLYTGTAALPQYFWSKLTELPHSRAGQHQAWKTSHDLVQKLYVNEFVYSDKGKEVFRVTGKERKTGKLTGNTFVTLESITDYMNEKHAVYGIHAKNREQNFALNLLMDPEVDLVSLIGQAGSGKTLLALAAALQQVENGKYSEIIITRATISAGEDIGFLPGTEEDKMGPWMGALDDNLDVLAEINPDKTKKVEVKKSNRGQNIIQEDTSEWRRSQNKTRMNNFIKIKSLNFMRGRTFLGKFVIVDEAQNLTPKQMKTLITRAGPGTKMVYLGNLSQIDTPFLTEGSSGLTYAVDRVKGWEHGGHIILPKGERSRLANFANEVL